MKNKVKIDDLEGSYEEKEFDSTDVAEYLERLAHWLNENFTVRPAIIRDIVAQADFYHYSAAFTGRYWFGGYEDEYPVEITITKED